MAAGARRRAAGVNLDPTMAAGPVGAPSRRTRQLTSEANEGGRLQFPGSFVARD